ncbi:MAG: helix-turn-helix domain-containing protein [Stappiaceae bacterium]
MQSSTLVILIGTTPLGLMMSAYLFGLARRHRFVVASTMLALAFALVSLSAALLAIHLVYDIPVLVRMRALIGLLAVPCLYLYFASIKTEDERLSLGQLMHLLPVLAGAIVLAIKMTWFLDVVLAATLLIYTLALIVLWQNRENRFASLGTYAPQTVLWLQVVILFLALSLVLDVLISFDLADGGLLQQSTPLLLSIASLIALVSFSLLGALGRPSLYEHFYNLASEVDLITPRQISVPTAEQIDLSARALELLGKSDVLSDDSLTVTRLARRLGVPARKLSQAINCVDGRSFSDLLNDQRVDLCKSIMQGCPDKPLLNVMMDAGYLTKSNFYKQFSKRTGRTPAAYRTEMRHQSDA